MRGNEIAAKKKAATRIHAPRPALCMVVFTALLAAVLVFAGIPSGERALAYSAQEIELVQLINQYRASVGLDPLMVSDAASNAAKKHSSDMATYSFFSHTSKASSSFPVGSNAGDRLTLCGYPSNVGWGENIAAGYSSASGVVEAWKASTMGHNEMMIYSGFKVIGVGLVYSANSPYGYYWTVDFGEVVDATAHWLSSSATTSSTVPSSTTTTTTGSATTTPTTPSTSTTTTSTTTTPAELVFPDVPATYKFYEPIMQLAAAGVVNGCVDGLFYPDEPVTRAQFAKIIVSALGAHTDEVDNLDAPTFPDVAYTGTAYPFDFVEEAAGLGIIQGHVDGTFAPQAYVTRLQLALMLVRAGGDGLAVAPAGYACPFTDVPDYGRAAVATAYYNGLLVGKTSTMFDSYTAATRGYVVGMVYALLQALGL